MSIEERRLALRRQDCGHSRLAAAGIVLTAIVLRAFAFSPLDLHHADELMQYLEQAHRLATGHGIVPWETRYGVRNELIPQLLSVPMAIAGKLAPGTLAPFYAARISYAVLTLLALPAAWRLGALTSRRHALVALFVVAIWWQSILFSDLLLSESLAAATILLGTAPLLDDGASKRELTISGFLLALGLLFRFQFAPFVGVLTFYAVLRDVRHMAPLMVGMFCAMAIGAVSDALRGAMPFGWIFANFTQNIGAGRAARFGASGPSEYLAQYYHHFGAAALICILIGVAPAARRYAPLLMAAAVTIAAHSLIAHKEYRFVWIATLAGLMVAAIGSLMLADRLLKHRAIGGNVRIVATCTAWSLLSIASFCATGGYRSMRGGGGLSELAIVAARDPRVCRLAVTQSDYFYVAPAILPRSLPLSVIPADVEQNHAPLPLPLLRAANAVLAGPVPPAGAEHYRKVTCRNLATEQACLYRRLGRFTPDPVYNLQAAIEHSGL